MTPIDDFNWSGWSSIFFFWQKVFWPNDPFSSLNSGGVVITTSEQMWWKTNTSGSYQNVCVQAREEAGWSVKWNKVEFWLKSSFFNDGGKKQFIVFLVAPVQRVFWWPIIPEWRWLHALKCSTFKQQGSISQFLGLSLFCISFSNTKEWRWRKVMKGDGEILCLQMVTETQHFDCQRLVFLFALALCLF